MAERAEKQQKADAAALHAIHAQEAGALRWVWRMRLHGSHPRDMTCSPL